MKKVFIMLCLTAILATIFCGCKREHVIVDDVSTEQQEEQEDQSEQEVEETMNQLEEVLNSDDIDIYENMNFADGDDCYYFAKYDTLDKSTDDEFKISYEINECYLIRDVENRNIFQEILDKKDAGETVEFSIVTEDADDELIEKIKRYNMAVADGFLEMMAGMSEGNLSEEDIKNYIVESIKEDEEMKESIYETYNIDPNATFETYDELLNLIGEGEINGKTYKVVKEIKIID